MCDTKIFLKESESVGYSKKLDELSKDEKSHFRRYGICPDCKQMNTGGNGVINVFQDDF